jgi:hypothetical protein
MDDYYVRGWLGVALVIITGYTIAYLQHHDALPIRIFFT